MRRQVALGAIVVIAGLGGFAGLARAEETCVPVGTATACAGTYADPGVGEGVHASGDVPDASTQADVVVPTRDYDYEHERFVEAEGGTPAGPVHVHSSHEGWIEQEVVVVTDPATAVAFHEDVFLPCGTDERVIVDVAGDTPAGRQDRNVWAGSYDDRCFPASSEYYVRVDGQKVVSVPKPQRPL